MNIPAHLLDCYHNDPLVHRILESGGGLERVIVALVQEKQQLIQKLIELDAIAPKRYQLADGSQQIWRCPDYLVPLHPLPAWLQQESVNDPISP